VPSEAKWYRCNLAEPNLYGDWATDVLEYSPEAAVRFLAKGMSENSGDEFEGIIDVLGFVEDGEVHTDGGFPKRFEVTTKRQFVSTAEEVAFKPDLSEG